jgi:predicted  nucleic acid-binding Zn-ribbon protein
MSQPNEINTVREVEVHGRPSIWLPALAAGLALVGGFAFYQNAQLQDVRRDLAASQKDVTAIRTSVAGASDDARKQIDTLRGQLVNTQQQSAEVLTKAQTVAKRRADAAVAKLDKQQAERVAALDAELNQVKENTAMTSTRLAGVSSDVSAVQSDVADAKSRLEKTNGELQSVRGDMGVMSGLVATNSQEIETLRKLGDRNIYEFKLTKAGGLERVGDISLRVVKTNIRRNQYSLVVSADDKLIEKKDKTTNEPVQFYVASKARQPYEIVVNEVSKNTIKGYLATPKVTTARN